MRIRLEKRLAPSRFMQIATPIASVLLTMLLGAIIFQLIGFDGPRAIYETFITPIVASYKWQDVATKAAPLIIIALGLSLGNQAKIWNIGAEGQYIIGALAGAGVAFALPDAQGFWVIPLMIVAGVLGGRGSAAAPGVFENALPGVRSAVDPDAGLCRAAGPQLSSQRPVEGSERTQFPADPAVHAGATPSPRHCGNRHSARPRRGHSADAHFLAARDALGLRLFGPHRRRRAQRRALWR